ncbi:MAG: hypothetical protein GY909_15535 [Oligoflexia bacterium]|nr:hypothetical protein [Oligoflexia bacterium]
MSELSLLNSINVTSSWAKSVAHYKYFGADLICVRKKDYSHYFLVPVGAKTLFNQVFKLEKLWGEINSLVNKDYSKKKVSKLLDHLFSSLDKGRTSIFTTIAKKELSDKNDILSDIESLITTDHLCITNKSLVHRVVDAMIFESPYNLRRFLNDFYSKGFKGELTKEKIEEIEVLIQYQKNNQNFFNQCQKYDLVKKTYKQLVRHKNFIVDNLTSNDLEYIKLLNSIREELRRSLGVLKNNGIHKLNKSSNFDKNGLVGAFLNIADCGNSSSSYYNFISINNDYPKEALYYIRENYPTQNYTAKVMAIYRDLNEVIVTVKTGECYKIKGIPKDLRPNSILKVSLKNNNQARFVNYLSTFSTNM